MKRTGSAVWKGGLKDGGGALSSESGTLDGVNYSWAKRFGDEKGTNPEELVGAAHAACYSMQLSGVLGAAGLTPDEIRTTAAVTGSSERRRLHHHRRAPDRRGEGPRRRRGRVQGRGAEGQGDLPDLQAAQRLDRHHAGLPSCVELRRSGLRPPRRRRPAPPARRPRPR